MTSPSRPLAPGVAVRPWRHFFGTFALAPRVSIHPGTRGRGRGIEPLRPARAPDATELDTIDGAAHPDLPALHVFTTPAYLREQFEALDPDELPPHATPRPLPRWSAFATEVFEFYAHVQAPVRPPHRLALDVRDPDEPPALLAGGACRTLLLDIPILARGGDPGDLFAAHVNLGAVPTALVFFTVPLPAMAALLATSGTEAPPDGPGLVLGFAKRFPDCPVVRLALAPGEGVLVPPLLVAHDVDAHGAGDLVVTLSVLPGA